MYVLKYVSVMALHQREKGAEPAAYTDFDYQFCVNKNFDKCALSIPLGTRLLVSRRWGVSVPISQLVVTHYSSLILRLKLKQ